MIKAVLDVVPLPIMILIGFINQWLKFRQFQCFLPLQRCLFYGYSDAVQAQSAGGLKEWSTDQGVDEKSLPDADAAALMKQAEEEDVCVPIGEGENCW